MAIKCPNCGAENPATAWFCQICDSELRPTYVEVADQAAVPVPPRRKKTIILVIVVAIVVVSIVAATLAYYYQPVRGSGYASLTTVCVGSSIEFYFSPSQGIGPYRYSWSFGDGSISSAKNPTHTYGTTGTYTASVIVTDGAEMKCSWSTTITVRLALVFIDRVTYPSSVAESWAGYYFGGHTYYNLFVDGVQRSAGVGLQPGSNHSIGLQIIGVVNLNTLGGPDRDVSTTLVDVTRTVMTQTTNTDIHCALNFSGDVYSSSCFTLTAT
jgi:hypothetical protein